MVRRPLLLPGPDASSIWRSVTYSTFGASFVLLLLLLLLFILARLLPLGVGLIETRFSDLTLPCCFSIESRRCCIGEPELSSVGVNMAPALDRSRSTNYIVD